MDHAPCVRRAGLPRPAVRVSLARLRDPGRDRHLAGRSPGGLSAGCGDMPDHCRGRIGDHIVFGPPWRLMPWVKFQNLRLADFLNKVFLISVVWGLVNLLPIYPLDGGQIAREIALWLTPREGIRYSLVLSIIAAVGMAAFGMQTVARLVRRHLLRHVAAYSNYNTLQALAGRVRCVQV